jgi:ADP-ribose pyrophosphatase YjhB (NUDIX family)
MVARIFSYHFPEVAMKDGLECPNCGATVIRYRNPIPTVDVIIRVGDGVVLIKRKNPPYGWAIPGGFVDYGERAEDAAVREALEETSLHVEGLQLFGVYSDPARDPRHHTLTVVYTAHAEGVPEAQDDAVDIGVFTPDALPSPMAFDHGKILRDFFREI